MHPMFMKLYLETSKDELLAREEGRRRAANRSGVLDHAWPLGPSSATGIACRHGDVCRGGTSWHAPVLADTG